jgi:DNA-binding transcriptional LysR family regulator
MIAVRVTGDMRQVAVASPDYVARHGHPQAPADLHAHNCLRFRFPSGAFIPWQFVVEGKLAEFEVGGSVVVNEPDLLISAALEGIGIVYIMEEYVAPMIADGRLISLFEDSVLPRMPGFCLFYPSRRQNPAALQALIEFLRANLRSRDQATGISNQKSASDC